MPIIKLFARGVFLAHAVLIQLGTFSWLVKSWQAETRLDEAPGAPAHYMVKPVKEGQGETCINIPGPKPGQIVVEEGSGL